MPTVKARMRDPNSGGDGILVRPVHFDRTREQVTTLARAIGYHDFSDPVSPVFRAQSPDRGQNGDWQPNSRNRVTLPDFTDLGDGAWKLLRWFRSRPATDPVNVAFFTLLKLATGGDDGTLFDTRLESWEVARIITECALGVLEPAEKRGWV